MRATYKILLTVGIAALVGFAAIAIGYEPADLILQATSDEAFEEDFARIPEVKIFIEEYPDYGTYHYADFSAWKIIGYASEINDVQSIHMEARKNVLSQKVRISAGCSGPEPSFAFDIPHDQVADFLRSDGCLGERK